MKKYTLEDNKKITADDEPIDVSDMNFFDDLEYDSWNLFLQYCAALGIEVENKDEPDWATAKGIQDKILDILIGTGVKFKF